MGWYSTVQVLYGVPSLLLMIVFLVLFFGKPFRHPFYRLVQFDLFVNITCYINSWLAMRFMESEIGAIVGTGIESLLPGFLTFSVFLLAWYFHMQCASAFLLSMYRLTAVAFPHAELIWERRYFLAIVTSVLYSCIIMSPVFLGGFAETITLQEGKLRKEFNQALVSLLYAMNPLFAMFYFAIITSSGVLTVIFIKKAFRAINTRSNVANTFVRKMTVVALINSAMISGNLFFTIVHGILYVLEKNMNTSASMKIVMSFSSDMITLAMPYILLGIDHKVQTVLQLRKSIVSVRPIEFSS